MGEHRPPSKNLGLTAKAAAWAVGLALVLAPEAQAGDTYIQINAGYNVMPYSGQKGLNEIVDHYNASRPWLSAEMGPVSQGHGPAFNIQIMPDDRKALFYTLGFHQRWSTVEARGLSGGVDQTRQLSQGAGTIYYGVGGMGPLGDLEDTGFLLAGGATIDVTFMRVTTRFGPPLSLAEQDWVELMKKPVLGGSIFLQLTRLAFESDKANVGLSIKPFYQVWFANVKDYGQVNTAINPVVQALDDDGLPIDKSGYGGFGITVTLSLFFEAD